MSKSTMCIKMLHLLNTGQIFKINDLAILLKTNKRNILEYKKELDNAGYNIVSIRGKYGGYKLINNQSTISASLDELDKESLFQAYDFILKNDLYPQKEPAIIAFSKLLSSIERTKDNIQDVSIIGRYQLAMTLEEQNKRYIILYNAINDSKKVSINYLSNNNTYSTRIIHPYKLYMYNSAWFVIAWCEKANDIRYFKLCRMKEITETNDLFSKYKFYNEHQYLNSLGMTKNGEYYPIKLHFKGKSAMYIKDCVYGKNQIITECEDGTTILSLDMQYKDSIVKFVLNYAGECSVLEPEWLKEDVKQAAEKILKTYKID